VLRQVFVTCADSRRSFSPGLWPPLISRLVERLQHGLIMPLIGVQNIYPVIEAALMHSPVRFNTHQCALIRALLGVSILRLAQDAPGIKSTY